MSPVESWVVFHFSCIRVAWVPFPAPGGPNKIRFMFKQASNGEVNTIGGCAIHKMETILSLLHIKRGIKG